MPPSNEGTFYASVRDTAAQLIAAGLVSEGKALEAAMHGSTGGEVLGALGSWLKKIAAQKNVPSALLPAIQKQISTIDSAFDQVSQPRPKFPRTEQKVN